MFKAAVPMVPLPHLHQALRQLREIEHSSAKTGCEAAAEIVRLRMKTQDGQQWTSRSGRSKVTLVDGEHKRKHHRTTS